MGQDMKGEVARWTVKSLTGEDQEVQIFMDKYLKGEIRSWMDQDITREDKEAQT